MSQISGRQKRLCPEHYEKTHGSSKCWTKRTDDKPVHILVNDTTECDNCK